tara:strand:+ start:203 stop:481 length:279 start_codon:yes stop_codon:yes gene_type:complete
MAKRKTPKAKPSKNNITNEELKQIQDLVRQIRAQQSEVGVLETKKHSLLHAITQTQQAFGQLNKSLEETYGSNVDIDINSGEIKQQDEQANS